MVQVDDKVLWEQFRQGNTQAFASLYGAYYNDLLWFGIHYCGDPELVRDEINQQFLQFWEKRNTLPEVGQVKHYLITAFRNRLVNALKRSGSPLPDPATEIASPSWEQELIGLQDQEKLRASVKAAIRSLAPRQRQVVLLRYYRGLPASEIALRTGLSSRTVYNTLHTALKLLRAALDGENPGQRPAIDIHRLLSLLLLVH